MDPARCYDFSGKTIAITGGSGVLCSAMAQALAACHANVVILGRNLALAEAGEKYRQDFFRAGLDPLRAIDPAKEVSAAYSPNGLWRCEARSKRYKTSAPLARLSRKISATRWRRLSATNASRSMSDGKSAPTRTPRWPAPWRCSSCAGDWPRWRDITG